MSAAKFPEIVSVEQYLDNEDPTQAKCEYINGWVRAMTGATVRHNKVKVKCLQLLSDGLGRQAMSAVRLGHESTHSQ